MKTALWLLLLTSPLVSLAALDDTIADQQQAIERYQKIAGAGGWKALQKGAVLKRGAQGQQVDLLIQRLMASGDLADRQPRFNAQVSAAVEAFQKRHGLQVDGVVGPQTRSALNISVADRLAQLRVNLERMQSLTGDLREAVVVNVPAFTLEYRKPGEAPLAMRVIVGKAAWDTPSMSDKIESLVFNPTWNIPAEIVAAELAPKVAQDPNYLEKNNMVVLSDGFFGDDKVDPASIDWANVSATSFPYFVREQPGPENPLGQVKFLFPNNDDIYLHDTPDKHLFDLDRRAQSHGCIRLEQPFRLAGALVGKQAVADARQKNDPQWVNLEEPVPVHLVYWTAWVDSDGTVQFRKDIYNRDSHFGDS